MREPGRRFMHGLKIHLQTPRGRRMIYDGIMNGVRPHLLHQAVR